MAGSYLNYLTAHQIFQGKLYIFIRVNTLCQEHRSVFPPQIMVLDLKKFLSIFPFSIVFQKTENIKTLLIIFCHKNF